MLPLRDVVAAAAKTAVERFQGLGVVEQAANANIKGMGNFTATRIQTNDETGNRYYPSIVNCTTKCILIMKTHAHMFIRCIL